MSSSRKSPLAAPGALAALGLPSACVATTSAVIQQRTATLGPDRVGDVVLDLSAGELAAWLADPDAR